MSEEYNKKIQDLERKEDRIRIRNKNSEDRDAFQRVFDQRTLNTLYKFLGNGTIGEMVGIISQGKEANVYLGYDMNNKPLAIKIYKIDIQSARWMKNYIIGDPRFKKIGTSPDKVIFAWCQKEFRNLNQMYKSGISCPQPIVAKLNILIMDYIGAEDGTPALKLKDCVEQFSDPLYEMNVSIQFISDMYEKAKIVHGDLSEFNILYHNGKQFIIDTSQAVSIKHPHALKFLSRDIKNILNFYSRIGIEIPAPIDIYNDVVK